MESYSLSGHWEERDDEILVHGDANAGGGVLAFPKKTVKVTPDGIEIGPDAVPRLVEPPHGDGPGAAAAKSMIAVNTGLTGTYCMCIGPNCYAYTCDNNTYLGPCGTNCAYYGCKSAGC